MSNSNFNDKMFDAMLEMASREAMERELSEMPLDSEIKHSFSTEFERKMRRLINAHNKGQRRTGLKRAAAIFIAVMAISFAGVMGVAAVRQTVIKTVREIGENYFGFTFVKTDVAPGVFYPTYIPEGFEETSTFDINLGIGIIYENNSNDVIYFDQFPKDDGTVVQIDNEHSVPYELILNGISVTVYDGTALEYSCYIIWEDETNFYKIMAEYSAEELIKMAKSITAQQK